MSITESHIAQAIQYAKEGNPNDMQDSLGAALSNKITDAINLKKIELAGEFFGEKNDEDEEEENGSEEEEENGKNGKKKKKNPFAKKNGDDDEDDDDEDDDIEEGAIGDAAKAVASSAADAARTATHKVRSSRTREKYHRARYTSQRVGDEKKANKHWDKAETIERNRQDAKDPGEIGRMARRAATPSTRKKSTTSED